MNPLELKEFLDVKVIQYNTTNFIESDPIQIPHLFQKKEDIEIIAFLVATIAWGNRKSIIKNGNRLVEIMGNSPYEFVLNYTEDNSDVFSGFVHRTFNELDLEYFIKALQTIYLNHNGIEAVFTNNIKNNSLQPAIHEFKKVFFSLPHLTRTEKHVSDPLKNSAAKRINMYTNWII